jgi:polyisoprenoid-binding protein YceI
MKHLLTLVTFSVILSICNVQAQTTRIFSGSTSFSVKFILGTCDGTFDAPKGSAVFDENNLKNSSFNITIAANSFKTNNNSRDKDMKSEKYFFVSKYPEIHFKSSKVEKSGKQYQATGTLTMRDVSKTVTLPFSATKNNEGGYSLSSKFDINRLDYNIGSKDWKLKDIVTVELKAVIR